jgi:hypothetical protein
MNTLTFAGWLSEGYGESEEALVLGDPGNGVNDNPLVDTLESEIHGKQVTVRYWVTDQKVTREEAQEAFLESVFGAAVVDFHAHYSEITGYLWTDEELNIGGHDLLAELKSHIGKWLILEIDVHS